jgi:hypothetical protein
MEFESKYGVRCEIWGFAGGGDDDSDDDDDDLVGFCAVSTVGTWSYSP